MADYGSQICIAQEEPICIFGQSLLESMFLCWNLLFLWLVHSSYGLRVALRSNQQVIMHVVFCIYSSFLVLLFESQCCALSNPV